MDEGKKEAIEVRVGKCLQRRGMQLLVAESCTGGLIGNWMTNVAGSSEYFLGGVISYSNEMKQHLLHVRASTLQEHGAVSAETAIEMANGARKLMENEFDFQNLVGLSVTGIAGPGGASPGKPVGLVWIGLSASFGEFVQRFQWYGNRVENKKRSAEAALGFLLEKINV